MGSLPGMRQLGGLVEAIASFTSLYSRSAFPSSASFPVFRSVPLCQLKVSGLLVLAGSCTSLCASFPVVFIHPCPRALTQRGAELFRSVGVLDQQAPNIRALSRTGPAAVDKVRYSCNLDLWQYKHLYPSVAIDGSDIMQGMDLARDCVSITVNDHGGVTPSQDAQVWCEEQIRTTHRSFYANSYEALVLLNNHSAFAWWEWQGTQFLYS